MRISVIAFTVQGLRLGQTFCQSLGAEGENCLLYAPSRMCGEELPALPLEGGVTQWAGAQFTRDALIFVGATGIAVRAIAPHIRGKERDPAVVSVDELGRYAVPLLSGHLGGANRLARRLAAVTGGTAALSTATDLNGVFAVDSWAAENLYRVVNPREIVRISSALLEGKQVGLCADFPIDGALPHGLRFAENGPLGICIDGEGVKSPFACTMNLIPRRLVAGMGCRKGVSAKTLENMLLKAVADIGESAENLAWIASVDIKREEPGLVELCQRLRLPLRFYTAGELMAVPGEFPPSRRVLEVTGADNVCQRAAMAEGGNLLLPKREGQGCTISLSKLDWRVRFDC